ncbi:hypothetical protein [Candidatus Leptofilum sp.]|uniref:hypothetical protein n=1 Tax=Candidatus Leptofilum sp. TaxID=3241576 RepID=UPI003B5C95BC
MMKVKYALIFDALVLLVVAVGCLFNMTWVYNMLGISHAPDNVYLCQLLGAAVFGLALQNWLVRKVEDVERLRIIFLANFVGHGAAFVIFLALKLNGAGDATMWLAIGYTLLATLIFGYFLDRPQLQPNRA